MVRLEAHPSRDRQAQPDHGTGGDSKIAFVLSGGGSLGSVQVGCLEALMEYAIFPDLVVGTSVGALNGVMLAKNPTRDGVRHLKDLWLSLHAHGPFRDRGVRVLMRLLLAREFLFANNALRKLVCEFVADASFETLRVPALVVATTMETGQPAIFSQGALEPAVLASTAIPGVFPPIRIDDVEYVDGAMMSNCGLQPAYEHGARRIVVIEAPHILPDKGFGVLKPLARALSVSLMRLCYLEVELFSQRCLVVLLEPIVDLHRYSFNDFSKTETLMETGKSWTEDFLRSPEGELLRSFSRS